MHPLRIRNASLRHSHQEAYYHSLTDSIRAYSGGPSSAGSRRNTLIVTLDAAPALAGHSGTRQAGWTSRPQNQNCSMRLWRSTRTCGATSITRGKCSANRRTCITAVFRWPRQLRWISNSETPTDSSTNAKGTADSEVRRNATCTLGQAPPPPPPPPPRSVDSG